MDHKQLDMLGQDCPIPVVEAKKALARMEIGQWLDIAVDGETQVQNLTRMADNNSFQVESEAEGDHFVVRIEKGEVKEDAVAGGQERSGKTLVVFSSDRMGEGDDDLGKVLVKSCIFSITQFDSLPDRLIFYNGGVLLTTEGSPVLEDLENLEKAGVEIFSCGTCLKSYGLEDKLRIGDITNMYSIMEMQMQAALVIRP